MEIVQCRGQSLRLLPAELRSSVYTKVCRAHIANDLDSRLKSRCKATVRCNRGFENVLVWLSFPGHKDVRLCRSRSTLTDGKCRDTCLIFDLSTIKVDLQLISDYIHLDLGCDVCLLSRFESRIEKIIFNKNRMHGSFYHDDRLSQPTY